MAYDLIVEPEAELDLEQAVNWYNEQRRGLGREFIERVDETRYLLTRSGQSGVRHSTWRSNSYCVVCLDK